MILDEGICSVFAKVNTAGAGLKPVYGYVLKCKGWFASLSFTTLPNYRIGSREERNVSKRIRILRNDSVTNHDCVVLADVSSVAADAVRYEVTRAYHGTEDETGTLITDIDLEVISP